MRIEDVAVISRQISLALVGVIILSSMRLVLRGVTRVSLSIEFAFVDEYSVQCITGSPRNKSKLGGVIDVAHPRTVDGTSLCLHSEFQDR